jgi:hypothetical protein
MMLYQEAVKSKTYNGVVSYHPVYFLEQRRKMKIMSKITIRNSCIIIDDYELGQCRELERNFMVYDPVAHTYDRFGMWYDEDMGRLYLPRGLDVWKIKQYLKQEIVYKEKPNDFQTIDNMMLKYKPRDEQQKEALRFMVGVNEYEANASEPQLSVNLNTGKGKTYCSIAAISILKAKTMIITASVTLLKQWRDNILEYTNLKDKDVLKIEGSHMLNMILVNRSVRASEAKIFLCTHATLRSFGEVYAWERLNDIFLNLGIGIKIFDEAHTNYDNMIMTDFFTNVAKTYYVTATPARSNFRENRIYQLSMKNVPGIDLFDAVNDPHTEYIAIKYNSRPTPKQISQCRNSYGLDRSKYTNYVTQQPNFYYMLRIIMDLVIRSDGRSLFYIGTNEGILRVYYWIGTNYPEFLGDIGIYSSLVPPEAKYKEKGKKLLLSTTKSAGLGEHIEGLKMTIVLAEPFKSEVIARQTLGRTRDNDTVYIELVDLGFKWTRHFYYAKLPVFNKYASDVSDTTIDQYELECRSQLLEEQRAPYPESPIEMHDERFFEYTVDDGMGDDDDRSPIYFFDQPQ